MPAKPTSATLFAYQVGFGDCFLLRFTYPGMLRHVLIDFGTTGLPKNTARGHMVRVANDIAARCGGCLDAVVATHRHEDHISGFATTASGDGPGDIIRGLKPKVVVQPWTEDPRLAVDATGPALARRRHALAARTLARMQEVSRHAVSALDADPRGFREVAAQLRFIGEDNIANLSAVKNLAVMGRKHVYVHHESKSGLEDILPGVRTHVLGPPTLRQTDTIARQRDRDPAEFWQLRLRSLVEERELADGAVLFPGSVAAQGGKLPQATRWLADRMKRARAQELLQIVRSLDDAMNNTSVILLFQTTRKKLLFPGDAQIENWAYTLSKAKYRDLLASVDLYKVGHHGSLNATPRSMWARFKKKGKAGTPGRLTSVMSTRPGKHGHEASNTEVPRETLVTELGSESELHSTHLLAEGMLFETVEIPL
ncbi:MAG: hypothetical protein ABIQ33_13900 [Caldimonas sp.]